MIIGDIKLDEAAPCQWREVAPQPELLCICLYFYVNNDQGAKKFPDNYTKRVRKKPILKQE